jgi:hypothetical protein
MYLFARSQSDPTPARQKAHAGQSLLELALILPILLLILVGVVEISLFIGRYLDVLDLTREAARFASARDPQIESYVAGITPGDMDCSTPDEFNFYYDTACVFSPPAGSPSCDNPLFCNGLNSYVFLNPETDDVVISVYTITNHTVSNIWPDVGYWALSENDGIVGNDGNWRRDCQGNEVRGTPHFDEGLVNSMLDANAPNTKAFVAVEFYYCYEQVLNLPIFTDFVPNPIQVNAYTIMPLPEGEPTPTPITIP